MTRGTPVEGIELDGRRLAAWSWGEGPTVLLVHGWGGRGTQLGGFVEPLVEAGTRAVAFDHPAHGASEGEETSLPELARAIAAVARALGPVRAVIGHSLGGAATLLAIEAGLPVERAIVIGAPVDPLGAARRFLKLLGLPREVLPEMLAAVDRRIGASWEEFDGRSRARGVHVPVLVVHDRGDEEVPHADAVALSRALPNRAVLETRGLGHRRILRDETVIRAAVQFVSDERKDLASLVSSAAAAAA